MAFVVVFPAFVTVWRLDEVPEGQLVPSTKHTAVLLIWVLVGKRAYNSTDKLEDVAEVEVTFVNVPPEGVTDPIKESLIVNPVIEPPLIEPFPETRLSIVPLTAYRFVVVTDVPVALVQVKLCNAEVPVTVKLLKIWNAPVEVPP